MNEWTPVANKLPDDDTLVLVALSDHEVWTGYRDGDIWRDSSAMPIDENGVTHWMHLPEAPGALSDLPAAAGRRLATNQIGFDVQVLSPFGWRTAGFCSPYGTRESADTALRELRALDSMSREYRVYPALVISARTAATSAD